jgi:hypothetical protein
MQTYGRKSAFAYRGTTIHRAIKAWSHTLKVMSLEGYRGREWRGRSHTCQSVTAFHTYILFKLSSSPASCPKLPQIKCLMIIPHRILLLLRRCDINCLYRIRGKQENHSHRAMLNCQTFRVTSRMTRLQVNRNHEARMPKLWPVQLWRCPLRSNRHIHR